jgi:hypothetical protein
MRFTKKLLATVAAFSLISASPALAVGFSILAGSGQTGGAQRDVTFNGSNQVIAMQPTTNIAAGNAVVAVMGLIVSGGSSGGWSCVDTKSNTWNTDGVYTETATATQFLWSILGTGLTTSDTVTCTQASGPVGTTGALLSLSADGAITRENLVGNGGGFGDVSTLTVGPTSGGVCNGTTNCRIALCAMHIRDVGTTVTRDSNYTNIAIPAAGDVAIGYKLISSSTAAQSCTDTTGLATRMTGEVVVFDQAGLVSPAKSLLMQPVP